MMKRLIVPVLFCSGLMLTVFLPGIPTSSPAAQGQGLLQGSHGDRSVLPKSCRSCHKGMTMSLSGEEGPCLTCHGGTPSRETMTKDGYLKTTGNDRSVDIEAELKKAYNHPVLTVQGVHRQFEALPEEVVNAARHSECVDCHNPHLTEKDAPFRGLKGRRVGNFIADIEQEYELCFRCHSDSANLPGNYSNKHAEFKVTNPSYHPVMDEGKNTYVISLKEPYVAKKEKPADVSRITCNDCHGSDDPNGPRGPHGSNYPGLLKLNYQTEDARSESSFAYELCYKCHDRNSILNNESFPYHALHIQGRLTGQDGTSCFTCHDAHGSSQYQHLIRFNEDVVFETKGQAAAATSTSTTTTVNSVNVIETTLSGKLKYDAQGYSARHGACYLNCHGVEHNPKEY